MRSLAVSSLALMLLACSSSSGNESPNPTTPPDASADGSLPPIGGCDPAKAPRGNPCLVDDAFGIFASPAGVDTAAGTRQAPVRSLGRALELARGGKRRVFACAGTFEPVAIGASDAGSAVYGGFDCATWAPGATRSRLESTTPGRIPLTLTAARDVTLEDVEVVAADGALPGGSSVAVFVARSTGIVLRRVEARAGNGQDGDKGTTGAGNYDEGIAASDARRAGAAATTNYQGGDAQTCAGLCRDGTTSGGGRGGGIQNGEGTSGLPALAENPPGQTPKKNGAFGPYAAFPPCAPGNPGADGAAGDGGPGAAAYGALTADGWTPGAGGTGKVGSVAQGGGGGARDGQRTTLAGGGGGGCGGCGGTGGGGGKGGGASVALASFDSEIRLEAVALTAQRGGRGGDGGAPQAGQGGGDGGAHASGAGCNGGPGGTGGSGGAGGAGAGGLSVGVLYTNTAPGLDAGSQAGIKVGTAGLAGTAPSAVGAAIAGIAQPVLRL